jgi:hypothetical protein
MCDKTSWVATTFGGDILGILSLFRFYVHVGEFLLLWLDSEADPLLEVYESVSRGLPASSHL